MTTTGYKTYRVPSLHRIVRSDAQLDSMPCDLPSRNKSPPIRSISALGHFVVRIVSSLVCAALVCDALRCGLPIRVYLVVVVCRIAVIVRCMEVSSNSRPRDADLRDFTFSETNRRTRTRDKTTRSNEKRLYICIAPVISIIPRNLNERDEFETNIRPNSSLASD